MRVLLILAVVTLAGCSSAPKPAKLVSDQYCHTSQTINSVNKETVRSETTVKCTDDPVEQYAPAKMGLAKDCHVLYIPVNRRGQLVQEKVYACKKLNGSIDIIDSSWIR